jgi:casein kinase II subunit beta
VTDVFDLDCDDEMRETIEKSARHLYGLVHARYIVSTRGLSKMVCLLSSSLCLSTFRLPSPVHPSPDAQRTPANLPLPPKLEKYKKADFGKCPRVMCNSHPLLPMGLSDIPNLKPVKLYCARCEDTYNPKSSRHASIDGAYFGTSFHNILFQVYPALVPAKSAERYIPRVYGFKVHAAAALVRWQNGVRDDMRRRLRKMEVESGFNNDEEIEDEEEEEEEDVEEGEEQRHRQNQQQLTEYRGGGAVAGPSGLGGDSQMGSVA